MVTATKIALLWSAVFKATSINQLSLDQSLRRFVSLPRYRRSVQAFSDDTSTKRPILPLRWRLNLTLGQAKLTIALYLIATSDYAVEQETYNVFRPVSKQSRNG